MSPSLSFFFIVLCLLWVMSEDVEVSYDSETEVNLEVNTIFMAGNECCLSSMWCYPRKNHTSELLMAVIDPTACSVSFSDLCNCLFWRDVILLLPRHKEEEGVSLWIHLIQTWYWLCVYFWWRTARAELRESLSWPAHFNSPHFLAVLLWWKDTHTHTHRKG